MNNQHINNLAEYYTVELRRRAKEANGYNYWPTVKATLVEAFKEVERIKNLEAKDLFFRAKEK